MQDVAGGVPKTERGPFRFGGMTQCERVVCLTITRSAPEAERRSECRQYSSANATQQRQRLLGWRVFHKSASFPNSIIPGKIRSNSRTCWLKDVVGGRIGSYLIHSLCSAVCQDEYEKRACQESHVCPWRDCRGFIQLCDV